MKKALQTSVALALVLLISAVLLSAFGEATPFTKQDLNVGALYAGATPDEVKASLGEPTSTKSETVAATGDAMDTFQYDWLTLAFTNGNLTHAEWTSPTLTGPRGLKVGDAKETVLSAFYRDPAQSNANVLYSAGYVEAFDSQLPPCGFVNRNSDGTTEIVYRDPMEAYPAEVQADTTQYVYASHASLYFTLDSATETVTAIRWDVGALAE